MSKTTGQLIDELAKCMPPAQPDITRPHDLARYLTKREHIATAVLQGTLANPFYAELINRNVPEDQAAQFMATVAVEQADELIKALNTIKP